MDPGELHAMASLISEQARRLDEAARGYLGTQGLLTGPALAIAGEVEELTKQTVILGAIYLVNAIDIEARAEAIEADQAQVTEGTTPTEVSAALVAGGSVVGGSEPGWSLPSGPTVESGVVGGAGVVGGSGATGMTFDEVARIIGGTSVGAADPARFNAEHPLVHLMEQDRFRPAAADEMSMLPVGIFRLDGVLYDGAGNSTTDPSRIYVDTVTGRNRIRP